MAAASNGKVDIMVERSKQTELDGAIPDVESFVIADNGIGFTDEHRDSFDTLYTDLKLPQGGKGFGRFTCLKYFSDLLVESTFLSAEGHVRRTFRMGKDTEIIINESVEPVAEAETGSKVTLSRVKDSRFHEKQLATIARSVVERLLPYFIDEEHGCPKVTIAEADGSDRIVLNDFVDNELAALIREIPLTSSTFTLETVKGDSAFTVRLFKIYSPRNQRSKISLVADRREVTDTSIHNYIPEFVDEFYEQAGAGDEARDRNFIVKAYVFGPYLDANVSLERGGFEFQKDSDMIHGISQADIEKRAAEIARDALGEAITARQEKKRKHVEEYVENEAPWHRTIVEDIDLSSMPYNATPEEIETVFQKEKYSQEVAIRKEVAQILAGTGTENLAEGVAGILERISKTSRNDLVHYIAMRRSVLDIFQRGLELQDDGTYSSEGTVHDIIFPRRGDSQKTSFEEHNLWIVDERLNFTNFVNSDIPLEGGTTDRPDLLVFDKRVVFRGDNETSNPITIFEFKKPQRDDFVNPSSKEDPVDQIIRYVNKIRDGKYRTPKGRDIMVAENTPFYGYVVCDITAKVEAWLEREKNFTPMPDRRGWYNWFGNIKLYLEVLSWDKILKDAAMRNKVFFHTLGIESLD
ncbi:ATP-binding protein [Hyphomonas sp.]|uniref:ATP-binding protein n=1 Tax=Hyphomonas sp. TaxID=87 RepID=UPI0032650A75